MLIPVVKRNLVKIKALDQHSSYFSVNLKEENQMVQQLWAFSTQLTLLQAVSWRGSGNRLLSPTWSAGFWLGQISKRWLRTKSCFTVWYRPGFKKLQLREHVDGDQLWLARSSWREPWVAFFCVSAVCRSCKRKPLLLEERLICWPKTSQMFRNWPLGTKSQIILSCQCCWLKECRCLAPSAGPSHSGAEWV